MPSDLPYILCCDWNFPPRVNIWRATYGVRIRETTPSLATLWLGTKKQKFCGTNQKPELPRPFGTGPLRTCPQGLFSSFLTFLRPNFFLARFDFFPPPLTAPGSPRMIRSANTMSGLKSSSLTSTKTAECLSVEIGQIFGLFSNKSVVAHQLYWH